MIPLTATVAVLALSAPTNSFACFENARPPMALSLPSCPGDFRTSTRGSFNQLSYMYLTARVRGIAGGRFGSVGDGAKAKISQNRAIWTLCAPTEHSVAGNRKDTRAHY